MELTIRVSWGSKTRPVDRPSGVREGIKMCAVTGVVADDRAALTELLRRYADGRELCNCSEAYYSLNEQGQKVCSYGCNANLIDAKRYVAARALQEIQSAGK